MIDVSVTTWKTRTRPDPYSPLELENTGPVRLAGTAMLSDKQASFLGDFVSKNLPAHQREGFRSSVLGRLTAGMPGDSAVKQAMRLVATEEYNFTAERLTACGLIIVQDRDNSKRAGITDRPPRRRWRRPKG